MAVAAAASWVAAVGGAAATVAEVFLLLRNRFDKGQQIMGSPTKGTRSSTRGEVGLQREGRGRKK